MARGSSRGASAAKTPEEANGVAEMDVDVEDEGKVAEVEAEGEGEEPVEAVAEGAEGAEDEEEEDDEDEEEGEYEVEAIIDHKSNRGKFVYLVAWKGYGPEHNTWEPESNVEHAVEVVNQYWEKKPKTATKPTPSANKRGRPSSTPASQPAKKSKAVNGNARRRANESDEEEEEDYEKNYLDSTEKYEDVADWDDKFEVQTVERGSKGDLVVYGKMPGGEKVATSTEVAYRRCPQTMLKFYESHLKWKA